MNAFACAPRDCLVEVAAVFSLPCSFLAGQGLHIPRSLASQGVGNRNRRQRRAGHAL